MRRYIQQQPSQKVKQASSRLSKRELASLPLSIQQQVKQTNKRESNKLTQVELATLPEIMQAGLSIITPSQPKKEKRVYEPLDDEFIAKRGPGCKTIRYRRAKKQPLPTFDDRLARLYDVQRDDDVFEYNGMTISVTEWVGKPYDPKAKDGSIHLAPINMSDIPDRTIWKVTIDKQVDSAYLIDTPAGRVCPHCKTNEFIRSDLKDRPISYQDKNWRRKAEFGESCQLCRRISKINK